MIVYHILIVCILFIARSLSYDLRIPTNPSKSKVLDNSYDYPGSNNNFRQLQKDRWLQYYACLTKKHAQIKSQDMLHPTALVALEGTSVTLKCEICVSPLETSGINIIEWYFNSSSNSNITNELIEPTQHVLVTENNKYLQIYNIQLQQDGQYWCKMGDTIEAPYYLHIDNSSEGIETVYPNAAPNAQHPLPSTTITEYNIKVYTTWTNWSPCSKCNDTGIKTRYGYCTLSLLENPTYYTDKDKSKLSEVNENIHWNVETKIDLQFKMEILLLVFKNELPCKSIYIPNRILEHLSIKQRKVEMMVQYCKKKCSNDAIFKVYNKNGNTIESVNNSAGIYSMLQKVPSLLPTVTRTVLYAKHNRKIEIKCPGNLNMDVPITWKIGTKPLQFIEHQLNARIYINSRIHIVIKKLEFTDSNVYSCWQNDQLAGTIKLIVTGETELRLNYQVMMFGTIVIISVFTLVVWRVFKNKMRHTRY